jgi:hypothetical protein
VKLYLLETLTGASTSIINADGGLVGGAMRIRQAAGSPAGSSTLGALTYNTVDFSGPSNPPLGGTQSPTEIAFQETGPLVGASPMTGNSGGVPANAKASAVFLGTISVTASSTPGNITTFSLLPYGINNQQGTGDTITATNTYDLDKFTNTTPAYTGTTANPTSFTVSVVPEPTFAGIAVVIGAAGTLIRRRRQA